MLPISGVCFAAGISLTGFDVKLLLQIATENVANGQVSGPCVYARCLPKADIDEKPRDKIQSIPQKR